ncbi:MAG TPA: DNA-directed RNA polymerase subunit K [Geobacterales bacterium]|nr:DNA-directed RNA polymerase subunit K [Geobacterales bacterium]
MNSKKKTREKLELPTLFDIPYKDIRYERARLIGIRAMQLLQGAEPLIKVPENLTDPIKIAALELEAGKLPFLVKRGSDTGKEYLAEIS